MANTHPVTSTQDNNQLSTKTYIAFIDSFSKGSKTIITNPSSLKKTTITYNVVNFKDSNGNSLPPMDAEYLKTANGDSLLPKLEDFSESYRGRKVTITETYNKGRKTS